MTLSKGENKTSRLLVHLSKTALTVSTIRYFLEVSKARDGCQEIVNRDDHKAKYEELLAREAPRCLSRQICTSILQQPELNKCTPALRQRTTLRKK